MPPTAPVVTPVFNQHPCPVLLFTRPRLLEVLLLAWGVFFIARHNDSTPKQKARNFVKAIQRVVQGGVRPVAVEGPSPPSTVAVVVSVTPSADHNGEERPNWNIADGGPRQATSSSSRIGGRVLANENTV